MSQYDFGTINPTTKSGTQLAIDLNDLRDAIETSHSGATAPGYAQVGMLWLDNSASPILKLKILTAVGVWFPILTIDTGSPDTSGILSVKQGQNNYAIYAQTGGSAGAAGTTSAYTFDLGSALRPVSLQAGQEFAVKWNYTSNNATPNYATINLNLQSGTSGAKNIKFTDGTLVPGGYLISGKHARLRYDGTDMILMSSTFIPVALSALNMSGFPIVNWGQAAGPAQTPSSGATAAIDVSLANWYLIAPTGDFTLQFNNFPVGAISILYIQASAWGNYAVTLPSIIWPSGVVPAFSTASTDIIQIISDAGGTLWGSIVVHGDAAGASVAIQYSLHSQSFTSSGMFTTPANITSSTVFKVIMQGGGGGGGGGYIGTGAGGGSGGYSYQYVTGLSPSTSYTVTIGAGGNYGASSGSGAPGSTGGTTSFVGPSATYSATGGGGGGGISTSGQSTAVGGYGSGSSNVFTDYGNSGTGLIGGLGRMSRGSGGNGGANYRGNGGQSGGMIIEWVS